VFYVIRLSTCANSDRKKFTSQKTPKQIGLFMGFPGTFTRSKSRLSWMPGNKKSLNLTKWTWKPSPRSIGSDADENGQSRQAQHQIPIHSVHGGLDPNKSSGVGTFGILVHVLPGPNKRRVGNQVFVGFELGVSSPVASIVLHIYSSYKYIFLWFATPIWPDR
jgi:hypothetical protein